MGFFHSSPSHSIAEQAGKIQESVPEKEMLIAVRLFEMPQVRIVDLFRRTHSRSLAVHPWPSQADVVPFVF